MRIGFLIDGQLGQDHPILGRPRAHQMQSLLPVCCIMGTSQRFTITGNEPGDLFRHPSHPVQETLLKLLGLDARKHPTERIV